MILEPCLRLGRPHTQHSPIPPPPDGSPEGPGPEPAGTEEAQAHHLPGGKLQEALGAHVFWGACQGGACAEQFPLCPRAPGWGWHGWARAQATYSLGPSRAVVGPLSPALHLAGIGLCSLGPGGGRAATHQPGWVEGLWGCDCPLHHELSKWKPPAAGLSGTVREGYEWHLGGSPPCTPRSMVSCTPSQFMRKPESEIRARGMDLPPSAWECVCVCEGGVQSWAALPPVTCRGC